MTTVNPTPSREDGAPAEPDAPEALTVMHIPDSQIPYPDTPAWHRLGANVRRTAAARQVARARRRRWLGGLAIAAALVLVAVLTALVALRPGNVAAPRFATTGHRAPAPAVAVTQEAMDTAAVSALLARFDLDMIAVDLVRDGIADPAKPGDLSRVLHSLDLDSAARYYAAQDPQ